MKTKIEAATEAKTQELRPLHELARDWVHLWLRTGKNPVGADLSSQALFLDQLESAQVSELRDLLAANQVVEAILVPEVQDSQAVRALDLKVRAYIERFPDLLDMGWLTTEGYVFDLLSQFRMQRAAPAQVA